MPERARAIFVGAFPPATSTVHGGQVTSCRALLDGGLGDRLALTLVDSTVPTLPPPSLPMRVLPALRRVATVRRLLRTERPVAVLLFAGTAMSVLEKGTCALLARRAGARPLLFVRGGEFMVQVRRSSFLRRLCAPLVRSCAALVCQTPAWRRFFVEEFGMPADRCPVVENWTATPALLAIGERRLAAPRAEADDAPVRVLFVGWLDVLKGVPELLDAFARVVAAHPRGRVVLRLCGEGAFAAEAEHRVAALGLGDLISFAGHVPAAAMPAEYEGADLFVLPSHHEGLPNAMVEAMATALPVVVTPVGGVPDVITDGVAGRIVPVADAAVLASMIDALVRDASARRRLGAAAHALARARFGVPGAIDAIVAQALGHPTRQEA